MSKNSKAMMIVVTADKVHPRCEESLHNQDYDNYEVLINVKPAVEYSGKNYYQQKNLNIAANREEARQKALKTDAQYFLWGDSDIVYLGNTLSELILQMQEKRSTIPVVFEGKSIPAGQPIAQKHLMAGWYKNRWYKKDIFVMGTCVEMDQLYLYEKVIPGVTGIDYFGLGCVCMTRELLEKVTMEPGIDTLITNQFGKFYLDEGGALSRQVYQLGYDCWANGNVVCEHIVDEAEQEAVRELRRRGGLV